MFYFVVIKYDGLEHSFVGLHVDPDRAIAKSKADTQAAALRKKSSGTKDTFQVLEATGPNE